MTLENDGKEKQFMLRAVPIRMHRRWKLVAGLRDESMEKFALNAIETAIDKYLTERQQGARM